MHRTSIFKLVKPDPRFPHSAATTNPAKPSIAPSRLAIFVGAATPPDEELDDDAAAAAPPFPPVVPPVAEALDDAAPVLVPLPAVAQALSVAIGVNVWLLAAKAALQISFDTLRVSSSSAAEQPSCVPAFAQRHCVALLLMIFAPDVHWPMVDGQSVSQCMDVLFKQEDLQ
jgi:hypothetical protein